MFHIYILKSIKNGDYYTGYTRDLSRRLKLHNANKVIATSHRSPWEIFRTEALLTEIEAIRREQQIKGWKSRKAIERLKFCSKIEGPRFCPDT
jgi:putative endonuclease